MPQRTTKETRSVPKTVVLLCAFLCLSASRVTAQPTETPGQCTQTPVLYQLANYTVKNITTRPLLKFIPAGPNLQQALTTAIQSNAGLQLNGKFNTEDVSRLEGRLNEELERLTLIGKTGGIFARYRLINCDEQARTLEVQYQVLTVARPTYLTSSFEINDRKEKNKEAAGDVEEDRTSFSLVPFAGYNRSRAIFGGADFTYSTDSPALRKMQLSGSGSGSSAVVEMDLTGSKEFSSGPFSYAEWRAAYYFSNIPTDGFELQEATGAARLFAATRPIGSHKLFFRGGASIEGGNRQSSLPQTEAPAATLVDSGYGALKLYVGASLTSRRQDWKASYALQLGNDGDNLGVDYRKQILDAAYRLRFLPKDHKPFQLDAQVTAGWLRTTDGFVPYGERFFGGNADEEFIQGDSWRIRGNPFIRSFPQNRLNGSEPFPLGGDKFVSINLTVAQTVWQKQLIPGEIAKDPNVNAGLGGQLSTTRVVLREDAIRQSTELKQLEAQAGCIDETSSGKNCLTPIVNRLKTALSTLQADAGANDALKQAITLFTQTDDDTAISDFEETINSAKLDPAAFDKPLEDAQAVQAMQINQVEGNVVRIINDDFGDPDDPDDDSLSFITVMQRRIASLNEHLAAQNFAARKSELQVISADMEKARTELRTALNSVNMLRSYPSSEIQQAKDILNQPSASNRTLQEIAVHISALLKPERDKSRSELEQLQTRLSKLNETEPQVAAIKQKLALLLEYRELLDASDTWAEKVEGAYESALETKDPYGVKFDLERLSIGFGGLVSYVTGLEESVHDLREPLNDRGLAFLATQLNIDVHEAKIIQAKVKSAFGRLRVPKAEAKANETVTYVGRVLGVFFREANLLAVSPVFMFDAARLRVSDTPDTDRFRYGIGGGIRFSLINVDFTAGYSINPNQRLNEPRGALILRMDINDLFR